MDFSVEELDIIWEALTLRAELSLMDAEMQDVATQCYELRDKVNHCIIVKEKTT